MFAKSIAIVVSLAISASADYLYFSHDDGSIAVRDLNSDMSTSNSMNDIITGEGSIADIVIHMNKGLIFWTDESTRSIKRSKLDGSEISTLLEKDGHPYGLVIDSKRNHIYWSCHATDAIYRAPIDTLSSNTKHKVASISQPHGLELDSDRDMIYIAGNSDGIVYQYSLTDGSLSELMTSMSEPRFLAMSTNKGRLYVTEGSGNVKFIYFDDVTNGATTIIDSVESPTGIVVADKYVLLSDDKANFIYKISEGELPMTATANSILIESTTPRAVAIYSEDISPVESPSVMEAAASMASSFIPSGRSVAFIGGIAAIAVGSVMIVAGIAQAIQQKEQYFEIA